MSKLFVLITLLLTYSLNAKDYVELYEKKGIKEVEKHLDKELAKEAYWKSKLENKITKFGYLETNKSIIFVNKVEKSLQLYKFNNNNYEKVFEKEVITGEIEGDKILEGDKKTPIGVYDLLRKRVNLDQFYGPMALTTSYPNSFDRSLNKTGHGIWIHGMPLKDEREKFTQGCIALDNDPLVDLESMIDLNKTLLITSENKIKPTSLSDISKIMAFIYDWRYAWKYSNLEDYLSFYSDDFRWYNKKNKKQFSLYKKRVFSKKEEKIIKFTNKEITVYPNSLDKKLFRVFMDEYYKSDNVRFVGTKELILELKDGVLKILFED